MMKLKELMETFSLSEDSRRYILNGGNNAPMEFKPIAQAALSGHFCVKSQGCDIMVRPTSVEFYYHEEGINGIKDEIVYHRNMNNTSKPVF